MSKQSVFYKGFSSLIKSNFGSNLVFFRKYFSIESFKLLGFYNKPKVYYFFRSKQWRLSLIRFYRKRIRRTCKVFVERLKWSQRSISYRPKYCYYSSNSHNFVILNKKILFNFIRKTVRFKLDKNKQFLFDKFFFFSRCFYLYFY